MNFGILSNNSCAQLYTLTNLRGMTAQVSDFGAALVALTAPDREGEFADVTLGFDSVEAYHSQANPYFGATAGRYGNRIAHGRFNLEGTAYQLATNNNPGGIPCHLHGGNIGFNRCLWTVKQHTRSTIKLEYISPAGEEGYPGTLTATVDYSLNEANELIWEATATTDAPTIVNIVHHTYWNLSGTPGSSIKEHILQIFADHYLPINAGLIPTGELAQVIGTPMDFTQATMIGARMGADFEALQLANGYDHCWVLSQPAPTGLARVAKVREPISGRVMELFSNQPAVQFYAGNFLDETIIGKNGINYGQHSGFCLETEHFPDAPNQPNFPSTCLRPGETYRHKMVHRFSAQ